MRDLLNVFKLRIGVAIALAAAAGFAVQSGSAPGLVAAAVLILGVLVASSAAGAFNQYVERDIDARMKRTRGRPFVTGRLAHGPAWLWLIGAMTIGAVLAAGLATNFVAGLYVFLGAFTYGVVYTVWLKRRTWWNIVIGGLAGSFAVLAGAAAVSPAPGPEALWLAVVLFLWTPPHFWSLAIVCREDYAKAGVPMLPVVVGDERAARAIFASALLLVAASLVPAAYGLGWIYGAFAAAGGAFFLLRCRDLVRRLVQGCPRHAVILAPPVSGAPGAARRGRPAGPTAAAGAGRAVAPGRTAPARGACRDNPGTAVVAEAGPAAAGRDTGTAGPANRRTGRRPARAGEPDGKPPPPRRRAWWRTPTM